MHQKKFTANFTQLLTDECRLLVSLLTQVFDGEDTVSRNSAAMCTSACPVSLLAVDNKDNIVLVMLDMSVAFYTLNKDYLTNYCNTQSTLQRLSWLHLYNTGRYQRVTVDNATSVDCIMKYGVPQGSALGLAYTRDLSVTLLHVMACSTIVMR